MLLRLARLIPGLLLYGVADALMIKAAVGVSPWVVFAQGSSVQTGLSIGLLTTLIGFVVLLLWIPIKQKPGIGTVLNILLIGPGVELVVLTAGWIMGGNVGLGTVAFAFLIGPLCGVMIPLLDPKVWAERKRARLVYE